MIFSLSILLPLGVVCLAALLLRGYIRLRHIPGPLLSAFTNVPRAYWVWSNKSHEIHSGLHKKYGRLVRFGPNMISVTDPREIQNIYNFAGSFGKVSKNKIRRGILADLVASPISTGRLLST